MCVCVMLAEALEVMLSWRHGFIHISLLIGSTNQSLFLVTGPLWGGCGWGQSRHTHTHTHAHTHTHTHTHTLTHTHSYPSSLVPLSLSNVLTPPLSLSLSNVLTPPLSVMS